MDEKELAQELYRVALDKTKNRPRPSTVELTGGKCFLVGVTGEISGATGGRFCRNVCFILSPNGITHYFSHASRPYSDFLLDFLTCATATS